MNIPKQIYVLVEEDEDDGEPVLVAFESLDVIPPGTEYSIYSLVKTVRPREKCGSRKLKEIEFEDGIDPEL